MAFVRIKNIKNSKKFTSYIYLVENHYVKGKGSRQKVLAYIGKAHGLESFRVSDVIEKCGLKCVLCGRMDDLTVDHIVPILDGGTNDIENLQILCARCNKRKGKKITTK
jgi:5-methylcytosine-specific restriction endonuclease McrA